MKIREHPHFTTEFAPEGWMHAKAIADELGASYHTITKITQELGLSGREFKGKSGGSFTHYSPEDIIKIREHSYFTTEFAPEGWATAQSIADELGTTHPTTTKIIQELGLSGREFKDKRGGSFTHYSPEDIMKLREHPYFTTEFAPEGWMTAKAIAEELGTNWSTITRIIQGLGLSGKEFKNKGGSAREHYSPEDIMKIREHPHFTVEFAPEGWMHAWRIADELGTSSPTVTRIIQKLELSGKDFNNKGGSVRKHYSPDQIKLIANYYDTNIKGKLKHRHLAKTAIDNLDVKS
jgi:DNA-binding MarR family transcriptional regulator